MVLKDGFCGASQSTNEPGAQSLPALPLGTEVVRETDEHHTTCFEFLLPSNLYIAVVYAFVQRGY